MKINLLIIPRKPFQLAVVVATAAVITPARVAWYHQLAWPLNPSHRPRDPREVHRARFSV